MMTTEYTPETEDIREVWIYAQDMTFDEGDEVHGSEFDRWLQKVKAEAWDEGYADGRFNSAMNLDNPYH